MNQDTLEQAESRDLLEELLAYQKKETHHARVATVCSLALVVLILAALVALVPRVVALAEHVEVSLTELDGFMGDAQRSLAEVDVLVQNTNRFVEDNTESLSEVVEHINAVDYDGLNKAINDLADAVQPMAEFARMFR